LLVAIGLGASVVCAHAARRAQAPDTLLARRLAQTTAFVDARQFAAADSAAAFAIAAAQPRVAADSLALATLLLYRGNARYAMGQIGDTLGTASMLRALAIHEHLSHPDIARWVQTGNSLGLTLADADHADSALVILARMRPLLRPTVAGADSMFADILITTGAAQERAGRLTQAVAAFDSARVIRERLHGRLHPSVADALSEEGTAYSRADQLEAAENMLSQAIDILERTVGKESRQLIRPMAAMASVQYHEGEVARSIETLERLLALVAKTSGSNSPRTIPTLYNIAIRLFDFGDFASAFQALKALLPRAEAAFGVGSSRTESVRYMAGAAAIQMGDTASASLYLTRARHELQSRPMDENHISTLIERPYSELLRQRGDLKGADEVLAKAIAREESLPTPEHDALLQLLDARINAQLALGDTTGVDRTLADMAARFADVRVVGEGNHSSYLRTRAVTELARGRRELAWQYALLSEEADRADLLRNVHSLSDERALQLAGNRGEALDPLVRMALHADERTAQVAWDRIVRWRGLVTSELAARHLPAAAISDTALVHAHEKWLAALRHGARLEVAGATADEIANSRAQVDQTEREFGALAAAHGVARDTAAVTLARVRAGLDAGAALVSFVTLDARTDSARVVAFSTRGANGAVACADLGPERELRARLSRWRAAIEHPPVASRARADEQRSRVLGAAVRALTWDRIAARVAGAHDVVIVADGVLADLPWQALPVADARYVADDAREIRTLEAERDVLAARSSAGHGLLAVGDPDYDQQQARPDTASAPASVLVATNLDQMRGLADDCGAARAFVLPPLPGARAEVESIVREWESATNTGGATLLEGVAGTEGAFKRSAPGHEVLHLATHGILWGDACAPARAGLRGVGGVEGLDAPVKRAVAARKSVAAAAAPSATLSPALSPWSGRRVWLALAGANHGRTSARDENDGLLTASEVVGLDLNGVDWVVLSACQSGVGEQWPLEGALGMRRAFRLAGARAVISSQWSVSDESTKDWMRALYRARATDGPSASHAVHAASRAVLAARRKAGRDTSPFYWAAFGATGW
jgi:tetratricopeptide (TPR) repeat protein